MFAITYLVLALVALIFSSVTAAPTTHSTPYKQVAQYTHPNFFDGFTLYSDADPTYGFVDYVDEQTAKDEHLTGWIYREGPNTTTAFIGADSTGIFPSGRNSVRLTSKKEFKVGMLAVIDLIHIPVGSGPGGSGLWPAIWFLSPEATWPYGGEIDILEYVNPTKESSFNAMTLHTGPGCNVDNTPNKYLGELTNGNTDCSYSDTGNTGSMGCSIPAPLKYSINGHPFATAGPDFNAQGGGTYVAEWTAEGISVWLFDRYNLPHDIHDQRPNPKRWSQKPLAKFAGKGCDYTKSFLPMNLIVNVDVCGSWAGEVYPGGAEACNEFAANNPEAYREAYFEFGGILMYQSE
ncbi:uncharacterized protein LTR77_003207 [Saxophila tyrrhenica]|uniref:GH16 domain-containing protein n=1 Tax=Saxophila tyrrhenica TaxID=1690608 RepID=A0AAV9PLC6_9PEZI|nr:hypothetical protein LTR77_003207 [Saxophila tyrrhenica]